MSRAVVVSLFRGTPYHHDIYRLQFVLLERTLRMIKDVVDHVYIVDNQFNMSYGELDFLRATYPKRATIMLGHHYSHWEAFEMIAPRVQEDKILFIDSDTIIYNPYTILENFTRLDLYDVVSIFDSSGKKLNYPVMEDQHRFAPYLCFTTREMLHKTTMNFTPDAEIYTDSFSKWTEEVLDLGGKAFRLPDDRSSCLYNDISAPAVYNHPRAGYYHVRNFGGGMHVVGSYMNDYPSYLEAKRTMPLQEVGRMVMWSLVFARMVGQTTFAAAITECLRDLGIQDVEDYYQRFIKYHEWLETYAK